MKLTYIPPQSATYLFVPSSMLATSFTPSAEHETQEQYSSGKQFGSDFEDDDEEEW